MEKLLTQNCQDFSELIFSQNENMTFQTVQYLSKKPKLRKTLASCVEYLSKINDIEQDLTGINFGFKNVILNDELSNGKVYKIAAELARAIDENSVQKVKNLKNKYSDEKEFLTAKKFLDQKCKEIWNVYDTNTKNLNPPADAMNCLGITNQPRLETILQNSVKYYEKNNNTATSDIIRSVLNNKNMNYTISDIHEYLKTCAQKEKCTYNQKTIGFLIGEQNYNLTMLYDLGVSKTAIKEVFKSLTLKSKVKFLIKNIKFSHQLL